MNASNPFLSQMLSVITGLVLVVMTVASLTIPMNLGHHAADVDHAARHSQHMT